MMADPADSPVPSARRVWRARDALVRIGAEQRLSADEVIAAALASLARETNRRQAELDARRLADDAADRAEVAAAVAQLEALRAR